MARLAKKCNAPYVCANLGTGTWQEAQQWVEYCNSSEDTAMTPLPANTALDSFFLEARAKLLDLAAILDRIGRGAGGVEGDPRLTRIRQALDILADESGGRAEGGRAERVQKLFSLDYDPAWKIPQPRY